MKINIKNVDELKAAIMTAEGRATARTITVDNIKTMLELVDDRLQLVSSKTAAVGTMVYADWHAQHFPSAYRYEPQSTHFTAKLTRNGWVVTDIYRSRCYGPTNRCRIEFTPDTLTRMKERLEYVG